MDEKGRPDFEVEVDGAAKAWLVSHPATTRRVLAYNVKRCCGGGKICTVQVREQSARDDLSGYTPVVFDDGTELLVDPRAAARLPSRFGLTLRGFGPLKHLDLALDGEQWGRLLYD
ncbi:MAG TPA: hypothetical protein VNG04_02890 [Candidatus Acidoferrum sp.]|nr:hypothetical protein [Candidatus Acidoferrum sp.]